MEGREEPLNCGRTAWLLHCKLPAYLRNARADAEAEFTRNKGCPSPLRTATDTVMAPSMSTTQSPNASA